MKPEFGHISRWLIHYHRVGRKWSVYPPGGSFWGRHTEHRTFNEARADFIRQTTPARLIKEA